MVDFRQILDKMGYDEDYYSIKSRVFVLSVHADTPEPITFSIGDALDSEYNEQAFSNAMYDDYQTNKRNSHCKRGSGWMVYF